MATAAAERPLLRLATAGSVDDGKSTLIGRLLLDAKLILSDTLDALHRAGEDGRPDLAAVTDGLRAEREQGITIDVAYRYFATPRRSFIVADTPGHERYTRNMVTGASTAELAIVLIDARHGIVEQSRRHAYLSSLLGIRHLVAAVNKMDLVGWDEARFRAIESEFLALAAELGVEDPLAIPISALEGDNVVEPGEASAGWYDGPPLLTHLEAVDVAEERTDAPFRMPVQWTIRPRGAGGDEGRRYAGQIAGGTLRRGDPVVILPSGARTTVASVATFDGDLSEARAPASVSVTLADDLDVARGDVLAAVTAPPPVGRVLEATLCWMAEAPLRAGAPLALKCGARTVHATVEAVEARVDVAALADAPATELALNDIGRVRLRLSAPLAADPYASNRATGAFVLIDPRSNDTVAAGMVRRLSEPTADVLRSPDVTWSDSELERSARWAALGTSGATVWLTGLPASGKSTVAAALEAQLVAGGRSAYRLDGDNVRHGLSGDLGFSDEDRAENIRRVAHVARFLADAGTVAIVSLVSPAAADRALARELHRAAGLAFLEVWVDTPLAVCEARDPKGLYARARAGELSGLTGVGAPYEAPDAPELVVDGAAEAPEEAAARLASELLGG